MPARCVQGLQPLTAAGGRKKNCPGGYCAFLHSTSVHSKVQGTGASMGAGCLPVPTGTSLGESMTRCFPLDAPYHQGVRGHVLGRVPHLRGATRHAIASRAVDNGSGMYVAAQGQPRVSLARTRRHGRRSQVRGTDRWGGNSPRLARHGSAWSRVQVRVTTANGCFMAQRPTDAASGLLGLDGLAAGTQGSTQS